MGKVEERRARSRDAIVAAAVEVMAEGGAAALSLGEVARRLGMRTPSLYGYFDSRAALCDEIFRRGWTSYGALTADIRVDADTDLVRLVEQGLIDSVTWANAHRAEAELMFWRPIPNWQPSPEAFAAAIEAIGTTRRILSEARSHGLLRDGVDVEEMNEVVGVVFAGVISQQLSNEPGVPAAQGRISRHAAAMAAMLVSRYGSENHDENHHATSSDRSEP